MKLKFNTSFSDFLKGFIALSVGLFLLISFISYNSKDPSFNFISDKAPSNLAGLMGAYTADLFFQLFGLSSLIAALIPMCWSIIFFSKEKLSLWFLKILSGLVAISSASFLLSFSNYHHHYFSSLGGAVGTILKNLLYPSAAKNELQISAAIIFIPSLLFSLSISLSKWLKFLRIFINLIINALKMIFKKFEARNANALIAEAKDTVKARMAPSLSSKAYAIQDLPPNKVQETTNLYDKSPIVPAKKNISTEQFTLPSTDLLQNAPSNKDVLQQNKSIIKQNTAELLQVLEDFGVMGDIAGAASGPVVTLYEFEPAAGTKSSRIVGLADDIARSMRATSTRIAVIPGRNAIGIELPNKQRETVYLKELLESKEYASKDYDLPIILGKDISGNAIVTDLARMPHLLVAGTTGSGKSVAINTMILSLLYALTPEQCKFIMIDPKMLELSVYDGIPHLLTNVVTEPGKAVVALKWVVKEMETRYRSMSNLGVRNIHNYNERIKESLLKNETIYRTVQTGFDVETGKPQIEQVPLEMKILPFIVVIVDEMADLMLVAGKEIETSIQRLAQMARAAGIHIIMATQRPSVDVITGVIKANFPTRISFQVTSKIDSRTILGEQGAEQLLGKGDMLYMAGGSKITRIHGPFVADSEVEKIVSYLKAQGSPDYMADITSDAESSSGATMLSNTNSEEDDLYRQAVEIVQLEGKASTSFIQRCLKIGYNRAANIMEKMEKEGLVGKPNHVGKREIFM